MALQPSFGERTINELTLMFKSRQINLDPGFQRRSVWTWTDRDRLIQSILSNYPVPSIFLYGRSRDGRLVYDVIDGKQRIETILMFTGVGRFKRDRFEAKIDVGDGPGWYTWKEIQKRHPQRRADFSSYKLQTVEVTGELADIIDLFVRINSTGKRLTSGEKRHARFYNSPFLKQAEQLVTRYHKYFTSQRVLTPAQLDRMKGTELVAELLMSLNNAGPINKKTALDRAIGNDGVNGNTLARLKREWVRTMNLVRRMFPDLRQTRFHNTVDFYSLFLLVWEMDRDKLVLSDSKRNRVAFALLRKLSTGVDALRDQLRRALPARPAQKVYSDYLVTVQGDTDSLATRQRRREILHGLLASLYEFKDDRRTFTPEQRRIVWNSDERRVCGKCKKALTWDDFSVDHILAYARGGRTQLRNAQLMCRRCNSRKGSR